MKFWAGNPLEVIKRGMSNVHAFVKFIEPWSFIVAIIAIAITVYEINQTQKVYEATLFAMASEHLQKARETDRIFGETGEARVGQVRVLEIAVESGVSLEGINATEVRLDHGNFANSNFRNSAFWGARLLAVDFSNANLENALLSHAKLAPADNRGKTRFPNLSHANLKNAQLTYISMFGVNLEGTIFTDANLDFANLHSIDLSNVIGLEKDQLKEVCGTNVKLPENWHLKIKKCK